MEPVTMPVREIDRPFCRDDGGGFVPDAGMIGEIAAAAELGRVGSHGGFVFAMGADRQPRLGENPLQGLLVDPPADRPCWSR